MTKLYPSVKRSSYGRPLLMVWKPLRFQYSSSRAGLIPVPKGRTVSWSMNGNHLSPLYLTIHFQAHIIKNEQGSFCGSLIIY